MPAEIRASMPPALPSSGPIAQRRRAGRGTGPVRVGTIRGGQGALSPSSEGAEPAQVKAVSSAGACRLPDAVSRNTAAPDLDVELPHLAELGLDELQAKWIARIGGPVPQVSVELLRMLLAYHVQEVVFGGCHDTAGRIVEGQVADAPERSDRVGQGSSNATPISAASTGPMRRTSTAPRRPAEAITLPVGTRLVREWNGQTIRVEVIKEGFAWNGAVHASLSGIARAVTGARWSGPRFFGIAGKGAHG